MNFTYPGCEKPALNNINFSVEDAQFVLLADEARTGMTAEIDGFKKVGRYPDAGKIEES